MKLTIFETENYRSIDKISKIPISETTIIVGKNNEGKSNLLKALNTAMTIIELHSRRRLRYRPRIIKPPHFRSPYRRAVEGEYNWERDFPVKKQNNSRFEQTTKFFLEFVFSKDEAQDFKKKVGIELKGNLQIKIDIGKDDFPSFTILRNGKPYQYLNKKSDSIAYYVANKISFNYIPAIRTHKESIGIIRNLLSQELNSLNKNKEYKKALGVINKLQEPILKKLSEKIKEPLSEFLPNIREVEIGLGEAEVQVANPRDFEVTIDDGTKTKLEYKGDGVKSLATLGLLKNRYNLADASIIAIEEPESHLHPGAIRQIREILDSLQGQSQIVLTTHNPSFVNRKSVSSNIIVDKGEALRAKNIEEIREVLGVKISDNLTNAAFVLVVEGNEDKVSLEAIFSELSPTLKKSLNEHYLVIDILGGASKLDYKLNTLTSQLCGYHVLLDDDKPGNSAKAKAFEDRLLTQKNLTQTTCSGMKEAEFEDCIVKKIYKNEIEKHFGIVWNEAKIDGRAKWSHRAKIIFENHGKKWTKKNQKTAKEVVANCIVKNPKNALCSRKGKSIRALIKSLENLINENRK